MDKNRQKLMLDILCYVLLIMGSLVMVGPFFWMVSTSFKLPADQFTRTLIPPTWTLQNFRDLFSVDINFPQLFFNSTYISLLTTIGQLLTCAMAAFCFAVINFKGRNLLFTLLLVTMMIPAQVTLIPNFIFFKIIGLVGSSVPLWLPAFWGGASPLHTRPAEELPRGAAQWRKLTRRTALRRVRDRHWRATLVRILGN